MTTQTLPRPAVSDAITADDAAVETRELYANETEIFGEIATEKAPEPETFKDFLRAVARSFAMFKNKKSMTGLIILLLFVIMAVFAPLIAPFDPHAQDWTALRQPPSMTHWLGTSHMGHDIFSQLVHGTRAVLIVGFTTSFLAVAISAVVGVTAGYLKGWKSELISAITNVFLVIPGLPLMMAVAAHMDDPGLVGVSLVLAFTGWAWGARVLRALTMSLRNREFIQAARANGEPIWRIITVEMLPNLIAVIASSFVATVTASILGLTTLSFIGLIPLSTLNWGTILFFAQANGAFPNMWWWYVPAGGLIALMGTALALINFGIDEYVNPRLRSAGERARMLRKRGMKATSSTTAVRSIPGLGNDKAAAQVAEVSQADEVLAA